MKGDKITARVSNGLEEVIMELSPKEPPVAGLNYLTWKLDETIHRLPGSWINEESRGIPVLPGQYKITLNYAGESQAVYQEVIADPRFDFDAKIDVELYQFQKSLNRIRLELVTVLNELSDQKRSLNRLIESLGETEHQALSNEAKALTKEIEQLQYKVLGQPVGKQVGAWQTFEVTLAKKIREAERKFMSSHQLPSDQEKELITQSSQMLQEFLGSFFTYLGDHWRPFEAKVSELKVDWK